MARKRESIEEELKKVQEEKNREVLRDEVREMIKAEREAQKRGEPFEPRLLVVKPNNLTEIDLEIYSKFKAGIWTEAEFRAYTDRVTEDLKENSDNGRDNFRDWIAGKAMLQFPKKDVEEAQEMDNH
jgi:hypothetical protein